MRLWIGVYLPHLALEVFRPTWSADLHTGKGTGNGLVVFEHDRVLTASAAARQAGVRPGMRRNGVLTLHADADCRARDPALEHEARQRLAIALMHYSPQVTLAANGLILMDVSASLRLFGGIRALRRKIQATIRTCGVSARLGMAPTGTGAGMLARAGAGHALRLDSVEQDALPDDAAAVRSRRSLTRVLSTLPLALLPTTQPFAEWFAGLGCRTLGDLRRLPRTGLKRRCGDALLDELDQALGACAERFVWLTPADHFDARQELPDHVQQADAVLAGAAGLLAQLSGWLSARQLAVTHILVQLEHERGRHAIAPTEWLIALSEPTSQDTHFRRLLSERLAQAHLGESATSAVIAVRVLAPEPVPAAPRSSSLFPDPGGRAGDHARLIELLCARLGADQVQHAAPRDDHRPEYANHWDPTRTPWTPFVARPASRTTKASDPMQAPSHARTTPRPVWLLSTPLPLPTRRHRPFYGSPLRLISPAERIESGWWDTTADSAMRDYFVAEANDHSCYWIFRERLAERDTDEVRWFLHGLFG